MADLKHPTEVATFLKDFLSETELLVFAKRIAILWELEQNKSYTEIKNALNVSSATISTVAESRPSPGSQLAVRKMREDKWAERVLKKTIFWK